jgi:hypothetical protein
MKGGTRCLESVLGGYAEASIAVRRVLGVAMARSRGIAQQEVSGRAAFQGDTLHLVRRLYEDTWDSIFCNSAASECTQRSEWGAPVKAFTTRAQAEALCAALSARVFEGRNPFDSPGGRLVDLTSFPPGPFRDWLHDAGLTPPPAGKDRLADWARWWKKAWPAMSTQQHQQVLAGLDKLRLYATAELAPPSGTHPAGRAAEVATSVNVFTVELLQWKDDDDFLAGQDAGWMASVEPCFSPGGGIRLATFRDQGRAATYRDGLQREVPQQSRAFYRNGFGVNQHLIEAES